MSWKTARFFLKLYIKLFHSLNTSYLSSFFKCGFKNLCFQLPQIVQWTDEMTRVISASTGLKEVSSASYLLNMHGDLSFKLYFPKQTLVGNILKEL